MKKIKHLPIKRWAEEDRPREKLLFKGESSLSEAELIAILIGSGNRIQTAVELSQHILNDCDNSLFNLARLSIKNLQKFKGIGEVKAITVVAALELGRRRKEAEPLKKIRIHSSKEAFDFVRGDMVDLNHEEFWFLLLKRNHEVIRKEMLSRGGLSNTVVDPKIIFRRALEESASAIIVAHNHPSGNLTPSKEDIDLTRRLGQAGNLMDISILDHIILSDHDYFSFADENMIEKHL